MENNKEEILKVIKIWLKSKSNREWIKAYKQLEREEEK